MTSDLHVTLAKQATARAHLAGAEAADLEARFQAAIDKAFVTQAWPEYEASHGVLLRGMRAARRRYWRELHAAALLTGHRWASAERLGGGA